MDLSTKYLGLRLKNPIVVAACPLSRRIDNIKRMEDAGAGAVVLFSLFEEQIIQELLEESYHLHKSPTPSEIAGPDTWSHGPEEYLEHIRKAKKAVAIPIIASLNGSTINGWLQYARKIEEAGADGIELNMYYIGASPKDTSQSLEDKYIEIVKTVKSVKIPVSIKLSPYFTSLSHFAKRLDDAHIDGLVMFNRFYQPDFDLESLLAVPHVVLSHSIEMRLALRWVAILHGQVRTDLAGTGGIHTSEDALKMLMAGANVTMMCSALLRNGINFISDVVREMELWMEQHQYESVRKLIGTMSQKSIDDSSAMERANYIKILTSY